MHSAPTTNKENPMKKVQLLTLVGTLLACSAMAAPKAAPQTGRPVIGASVHQGTSALKKPRSHQRKVRYGKSKVGSRVRRAKRSRIG